MLIPVNSVSDILPAYCGTPIEWLLRYHNLRERQPPTSGRADLLVGMCMDDRAALVIPNEFAYVLRAAGANFRDHTFDISYAIAVGGVQAIAVMTHTDCGMVGVRRKRDAFIAGLVERAGWSEDDAARHFDESAAIYEIGNPVEFVREEARRLARMYSKVLVAPLLYQVEDDRMVQISD